ncbi:hypothetical protein COO60DRAFT_1578186, partial [Scenedesmus sp. NREL 46B-D3]
MAAALLALAPASARATTSRSSSMVPGIRWVVLMIGREVEQQQHRTTLLQQPRRETSSPLRRRSQLRLQRLQRAADPPQQRRQRPCRTWVAEPQPPQPCRQQEAEE